MLRQHGEELGPDSYMLVRYEGSGSMVLIEKFEAKYGYMPTQIVIAKDVEVEDIDDWGLDVLKNAKGKAQPGHVMLR